MFSGFMVNTWLAATVIAILAGVVGFFVVARGESFAAHALPVGAFPGAAAAIVIGTSTLVGLVAFAGLGVAGIVWIGRRGRRDVATALALVTLLGLGALFLSMTSEYAPQVESLLFGQILGVSSSKATFLVPLATLCVLAIGVSFRPLLLTSVSEDLSQAQGISPQRADLVFLAVLGLATAMAVPVVGTLLVFTLMVGPSATAEVLTSRPLVALMVSVAIAVTTAWAAVALSYSSGWPVGFFVGTIAALVYVAARVGTWAVLRLSGWVAAPTGSEPVSPP
jgi:zinc/manganese transport system permease protein